MRTADHHQQWEEKKKNSKTKQKYHRMTIFKELHIGIRERRLPLLLLSLLPSLLQLIRAYKDMHKAKELIVSTRICWTLEQLAVHLEWCQEKSLQSFLVWNLLSWHLLPVRSWVTYLFSLSLNFLNRKKKNHTWKWYLTELDWLTQTTDFYMVPGTPRHPIL